MKTYHSRKTTKGAKGPLESAIQRAICEYLEYKKYMFWRQNNGAMFREGRYFAMGKYARHGVPDIIVIAPPSGKFIGLEVKRRDGIVSEHQERFRQDVEKVGGSYHIVRSLDDVIKLGL